METAKEVSGSTGKTLEGAVSGGVARLYIDDSLLHASFTLIPDESDDPFSGEEVVKILYKMGITENINTELLEEKILQVIETKEASESFAVASGTMPVESKDAYYDYPLMDAMEKSDTDPDDPVEFAAKRIVNTRAGETVALFHPKEEGVPGIDIHGAPIPVKQARDEAPKPQSNLSWEHTSVVSTVDGRFVVENSRMFVTEEVKFDKDLTIAYGDVDFVGKLVVNGNIEAGVEINVGKDLHVTGSIIGCNVVCGGNIVADISIVGSEETEIIVEGNLTTTFVENANLNVRGVCQVKDSFVTSMLRCSDSFDMTKGGGHFVSGFASARNGISVKSVGIPIGTAVRLAVGRDNLVEVEKKELDQELEHLTKTLDNISRVAEKLGPMSAAYQKLSQVKRDEIELLLDQEPLLRSRHDMAKSRSDEIYPQLLPAHDKKVTVLGTVYPDTIIEFPLVRRKISDAMIEVIFTFDDASCSVVEEAAA